MYAAARVAPRAPRAAQKVRVDDAESASDASDGEDDDDIATYGTDDDGVGAVGSTPASRAALERAKRAPTHRHWSKDQYGRQLSPTLESDGDDANGIILGSDSEEAESSSDDDDYVDDAASTRSQLCVKSKYAKPRTKRRRLVKMSSPPSSQKRSPPPAARPPPVQGPVPPVQPPAQEAEPAAPCEHTLTRFAYEFIISYRPKFRNAAEKDKRLFWYTFATRVPASTYAWMHQFMTVHARCRRIDAYDAAHPKQTYVLDVATAATSGGAVLSVCSGVDCAGMTNLVYKFACGTEPRAFELPVGAWREIYNARKRVANGGALARVRAWPEVEDVVEGDDDTAQIAAVNLQRAAGAALKQLIDYLSSVVISGGDNGLPPRALDAETPFYVPRYGTLEPGALRRCANALVSLRDEIVGQHSVKLAIARFIIANITWKNGASEVPNNFVMYGNAGCGKCLRLGTLVMMYDGTLRAVENVRDGDLLMGDDSTPRRVSGTMRGEGRIYKIQPKKGDAYYVNEDHIITLRDSYKPLMYEDKGNARTRVRWNEGAQKHGKSFTHSTYEGGAEEARAEAAKFMATLKDDQDGFDIELMDYVALSSSAKQRLKGYRVAIEFPNAKAPDDLPLDPWLLGYWLGNGSKNTPRFSTAEPEVVDALAAWTEQHPPLVLRKVSGDNYDYSIAQDGSDGVYKPRDSNHLIATLRNLNVWDNKHVPHMYKTASREARLALLAGLLDSDGHLEAHAAGFDFSQKLETLFDDTLYVARSLGFAMYKKKERKECVNNGVWGDYFRGHISGDIQRIPTIVPRKQYTQPRKQIKNVLNYGIEVTLDSERGIYCGFELDKNKRFVLGDFSVTHNTTCARKMADVFTSLRLFDPPNFKDLLEVCTDVYRKPGHQEEVVDGSAATGATPAAETAKLYEKQFAAPGKFKEGSRATMVGSFAGMTALKTSEAILNALGGMLFIDEAYNLAYEQDAFGAEAAGALVALLTRFGRSMSVVMAGQHEEFVRKLYAVNCGVESRFQPLLFVRYNCAELAKIYALRMLADGMADFKCVRPDDDAPTVLVLAPMSPPTTTTPSSGSMIGERERVYLTAFFGQPRVLASLEHENGRGVNTLVDASIKEAYARRTRAQRTTAPAPSSASAPIPSLFDEHKRALHGAPAEQVNECDLETAFERQMALRASRVDE